ncbi:MAG: ABC transporter ATP-binding protein [Planctomycetota bacterium]|nr:ABC transporter ATP-binding protein [Planctomycetota bacterium]
MPSRHHEFELKSPKRVILRRILAMAKPYRGRLAAGVLLGLVISALSLVQPYVAGQGINAAIRSLEGAGFSWEGFAPVVRIAAVLALVSVARVLVQYVHTMVLTHLEMQIMTALQRRVYRRLLGQSFSYFDKQDTGLLINRTIGDVNFLRQFYTTVLVRGSEVGSSVLFYAGAILWFDSWVAAVAIPFLPVFLLSMTVFATKIHPLFHEMRDEMDRSTTILSENVQGIQVVRAFGREPEAVAHYESAIGGLLARWMRLAWAFSLYQPAIVFLGQLSLLAMVGMTAYRVLYVYGGLQVGAILTVFLWARLVTGHMHFFAQMTGTLQHSLVSAERVFEILDARPEITPPEQPRPMPEGRGHVVFDHVTFGYDAAQPVLKDVTLDIPAGTNVALVGATGAGKSTLIKLLPRFYDPLQGRLLIDGADIRQLDLRDLRAEIGFVFQDTFLFSASLAENIAFGVPAAEQRAIEDVAARARVDEFAKVLEDGYNTHVGDRGVTLSGGQRQRVAIARALLTDPRILILDDATASVDSTTERAIQDALAEVMKDRTTFIIAHRISTVKRADLILVVDGGRIVQQGTHETLLAVPGPYQEFVQTQWQLGIEELEGRP